MKPLFRFSRPLLVLVVAWWLAATVAPAAEERRRLPPATVVKSASVAEKITRDVTAILRSHANDRQSEQLWTQVRSEVEAVLYGLFRAGELLGTRPEEAYFVRCDQSTMTAQDIATGRLKVQVGYAALKPAEFQVASFEQTLSRPATAKATDRKPSPALASLPAPQAARTRRILLVDDDWTGNTGSAAQASGSDKIYRELVAAAVGNDAKAWSVERVETYRHGPSVERLRDFNVVLWYTGESYGGGSDNVSTLSVEDEKTVRRYLEEVGGAFILISPGFLTNRTYGTTWTESSDLFLKEVMGVRGLASLAQRFAAGKVSTTDGQTFEVEARGVVETQFSAVNPDGAAVVFRAALDPQRTAAGAVPVAVAHGFGGGRFVYVGFSFENLAAAQRERAFGLLLEAATGRKAPPPTVAAAGVVSDAPRTFAVTGSGRDSFNFFASGTGPIRAQVQSKGVPITVAILHPDGRRVEHTGSGDFSVDDRASADDVAKGHIWGVSLRAATPTEATKAVATGTITVSHPPADTAAVQAQLDSIPSRTEVLRKAPPVLRVAVTPSVVDRLRQASLTKTVPPAPLPTIDPSGRTIVSGTLTKAPPPPPPPPPTSGPVGPMPNVKLSTLTGGPGQSIHAWGADLFPPGTRFKQVMEWTGGPEQFRAELRFLVGGQVFVAPMTAREDRFISIPAHLGNDTQTDRGYTYVPHPTSGQLVQVRIEDKFARWYEGTVPTLPVIADTMVSVNFVSKDGRPSTMQQFKYQPPMAEQFLYLPIADGRLVDSTLASVYPNADLSRGDIRRDTFLLGFAGEDTFYETLELKNHWKVVDAAVVIHYSMLGGAQIIESMPGTNRPFVKVRWDLEPTFLLSNHINYTIKIRIRGPAWLSPL